MKVVPNRLGRSARTRTRRAARPVVEGLEDRFLLYTTTGGRFAHGSRITYSFVPDGTYLGGPTSNLISSMDSRFPRAAWTAAFREAAATWSSVSQVNLVEVWDNGAALGSYGNQQGDPNFGDIRIGGFSMESSKLATTFTPPHQNGGTLAGDMLFNTSLLWQVNHDIDLETVAIHEFGHALGLHHSSASGSQMNAIYDGMQQTLSTDDVNGIRAIWGPRQPDWSANYGYGPGNASPSTATDVMPFLSPSNQITLYDLNITSNTDQHWYKVVTPANASGSLTTVIQSANLSMLSPRVQIYSASLSGLAQGTAPYSFGTFVGATINNVKPNQTYYIRTSAANAGISGAGNYALFVNMGNQPLYPVAPPYTTVGWQPDQGGGSLGLGKALTGAMDQLGNLADVHEDEHEGEHEDHTITIGELTGFGCELVMDPKRAAKLGKPEVGSGHPKGVGRRGFLGVSATGGLILPAFVPADGDSRASTAPEGIFSGPAAEDAEPKGRGQRPGGRPGRGWHQSPFAGRPLDPFATR